MRYYKIYCSAARILRPAALGMLAVLAACREANAPTGDDAWASLVVDSFHIRNEARLLRVDGSTLLPLVSEHEERSDHALPVGELDENQASNGQHVRFKHARAQDGTKVSYAFVHPGRRQPPSRVYGFSNGRLKLRLELKYKRVGQLWVRQRAQVSVFDEAGNVIADFDSREVPGRLQHSATPATATAVAESVAADGLVNNEVEAACWRELRDNLTAYAVFIATSYAATQAALKCPPGTQLSDACVPAATLAAAALVAFNKYMDTMDALTRCQWQAILQDNSASAAPPTDKSTETKEATDIIAAIKEFIRQALAAGTFQCNADGSYCVYAAAQQL